MRLFQDNAAENFDADGMLEQFVIQVPTIPSAAEGQAAKDILDNYPEAEGIVVTENGAPAGIIMRTTFYQKIGSLYGHSLYMKRPVSILMDSAMMKVDVGENISKIGIQAMNREHGKMYDYLVVYKSKTYLGVISIRMFLVELAKRNEAQISVLKNQQQKLISANEKEIHLRKNLEYQSASIRNLLDHADEGFLWFGGDLLVDNEYSYKCMDIFGGSIGGRHYIDLMMGYFAPEKESVFRMVFDSYFKNNSTVTDNVYLMLLPSDAVISGKNIHFEYRRIESGGQKAVMVVLSDITEKISMEKAIEEDQNKQRLIIKAFGYQAQIKQILDEFREFFSEGYKSFFRECAEFGESLNELFRTVHTFKGDLAQYGLIWASDEVHRVEDQLFSMANGEREEDAAGAAGAAGAASVADVERILSGADPEKMLEKDLSVIHEVLGESYFDRSEIVSIPKTKLAEIKDKVQRSDAVMDRSDVLRIIGSLALKNVKLFLNQYSDYLKYLSARVMKNMPAFLVIGDDVEIDGDLYGGFFKCLTHIFRNIMDHGIETDEERMERGKPERGLVECIISRIDEDWFSISISDD